MTDQQGSKARADVRYVRSAAFLERQIKGHAVLIPLAGGIGATDAEVVSLNPTGASLWHALDGRRTVAQIADELAVSHMVDRVRVEHDLLALAADLLERGMVRVAD
jgi:Coenzyme PQQ synthesis protein D (PqqD)